MANSSKDTQIDAARAAANGINMLVTDVDGVLTEGKLMYSEQGESIKQFSIRDGLGIKLLAAAGIETAVITGRGGAAVRRRCAELGIDKVIEQREDKRSALAEMAAESGLALSEIAYIGDDWPDLGAIIDSGFGVCVADAHQELVNRADWITPSSGGQGAVRDLADFILKAKGLYETTLAKYL